MGGEGRGGERWEEGRDGKGGGGRREERQRAVNPVIILLGTDPVAVLA